MSRLYKNKEGTTLTELIIATLLLSVVFMAVSSVYLTARKMYLASQDKVIISYELQYASQHIYKNVMRSIGDIHTPAFQTVPVTGGPQLGIRIHNNDLSLPPSLQPLTEASYNNVTDYSYYYDAIGHKLMFDPGTPLDSADDESLIPKVGVTAVNFTPSNNVLTGYITAYYKDPAKTSTFYFSCYPRLATTH